MKKQNTFKKSIVQNDDGTRSYKNENLWMHSVDRPVSDNEESNILLSFVLVLAWGVIMGLLYLIIGGN